MKGVELSGCYRGKEGGCTVYDSRNFPFLLGFLILGLVKGPFSKFWKPNSTELICCLQPNLVFQTYRLRLRWEVGPL